MESAEYNERQKMALGIEIVGNQGDLACRFASQFPHYQTRAFFHHEI